MKNLICWLLGHDFSVVSVMGKFVWCRRCAFRVNVEPPFDE